MLVYQVKITCEPEIEPEFLHWMQTQHVPDVIGTGLVKSFQVLKPQDGEPHTYYYQYIFDRQSDFDHYQTTFAPALKKDVIDRYAGRFTASRTIFERI